MKNNNITIVLVGLVLAFFMLVGVGIIVFNIVGADNISRDNAFSHGHISNAQQQNNIIKQKTNVENVAEQAEEMRDVLVPVHDIKAGDSLTQSMFKTERRPSGLVPSNAVSTFTQIDGAYAKVNMIAKNPISADDVTIKKSINTITANIPEGYRAVTINVNVTSSVEGWARAGAFVDVVWNATINGKPSTIVIIQNVKILSAERQIEGNPENGQAPVPSTVTLLVLAEDATKIHLAETTGKLSLQLRGDSQEGSIQKNNIMTIDDLLGKKGKGDTKYSAIVKIKGRNGKMESWGLTEDGTLVPAK